MSEITAGQIKWSFLRAGIPAGTVNKFLERWEHNNEVWEHFEHFALKAIGADNKRIGAKAVMERVRWEVEVAKGGDFKVNNNYTAYYARVFALKYPDFANYFETREVRGLKAA